MSDPKQPPFRLFDERYSIEGVAVQMRREAFRGRYTGDTSPNAMAYMARCTAFHAPSWTHIVFDREEGVHGPLRYRTFERCFTLVLTFVDYRRNLVPFNAGRAHPWVVALFGAAHYEKAWMEKGTMGHTSRALHLWCDEQWRPISVPNREQEESLVALGWRPYEFPPKSTCIETADVTSSDHRKSAGGG